MAVTELCDLCSGGASPRNHTRQRATYRQGRVGSGAQSQIKVLRQTTTKVEDVQLYLNIMHDKTQPASSSVREAEIYLLSLIPVQ